MARDSGDTPSAESAELARWVASVRARAPRESAPSPELWNAPKLDAAASLARELHRAGDRVRKWTTRAPEAPPTATGRGDALEEVVFHVVARAVPAAALREEEAEEEEAADPTDEVGLERAEAARFARAKALAESFPPFFSTREDAGGGDGVPACALLGDSTGASALEEEDEEEDDAETKWSATDAETEALFAARALPGDACARGLLLALADAPAGTECLVRVAPEYAYLDPSHGPRLVPRDERKVPPTATRSFPRPPPGVDPEAFLFFDVRVLDRRVAAPVRRPSSETSAVTLPETKALLRRARLAATTSFPVPYATKRVLREGDGWERPRPPFDVAASVEVRAGPGASGATSESPPPDEDRKGSFAATRVLVPETTIRYVSGDGTLPPELNAAVDTMRVGEEASVYVPPKRRPEKSPPAPRLAMTPDALELAARHGVEYRVRLLGMTHVRDVFGDGVVVKRRLEEGVGDFPGDCPVRDCAARARVAAAAASADPLADPLDALHARLLAGDDPFAALAHQPGFAHDTGPTTPLAFRLGGGAVPPAVETAVRLMLPGETALVTVRDADGAGKRYGYEACGPSAPPGAELVLEKLTRERERERERHGKSGDPYARRPSSGLAFVVRLLDFEKPVNWYRAGLAEMLAEADAGRLEGNALLKSGRLDLAREKYEKTLRDLRGIRGLERDEEVAAVNEIVSALTLNLAAAFQRLGDHAGAVKAAGEILETDPAHGKALWRRGVSLAATHEYARARADFQAVAEGDESLRRDVERELRKIRLAEKEALRREKDVSASALGARE